MSRIGQAQIPIPEKVTVKLEGQKVIVSGPKGNLSRILPSFLFAVNLVKTKKTLILEKAEETKLSRALYGLSRTLISNMVTGVSIGFNRKLQISGVGYRAQLEGKDSHFEYGLQSSSPYGYAAKLSRKRRGSN